MRGRVDRGGAAIGYVEQDAPVLSGAELAATQFLASTDTPVA